MSARSRFKKLAALAAETGAALLLVLALFWLFMLLLYAVFPSGTPLRELVGDSGGKPAPRQAGARSPEAALTTMVRDVRCRRGDSVAWGDAREGMLLFNHDAVQTFDRSGATISFTPGDHLTLGSNSMLVVTRLNDGMGGGTRAYRVHVEGELRGCLSASKQVRMEVAAVGHLARVGPGSSRFRFTPLGDNAASLAVYSGQVRVEGEDGVVRVPANFGITLRRGVAAGPALPLPSPPALKNDELIYRFRMLPPRVRFNWTGGSALYHFQLSGEPRFKKPIIDLKVTAPEVTAGTLDAGNYYWRVSRIEEGREGRFSTPGNCRLLQEVEAPPLAVDFPPQSAPAGTFRLTGTSRPGSRVYVNGKDARTAPTGTFSHELLLKAGVNLIRVEAVDETGNASYASRVVYGKPAGEEVR